MTIGAFEPEPDWPNDRPARVTWTLANGTRVTEEVLSARGGPDRPFEPEEIREKIHGIVAAPYPAMPEILDGLLELSDDVLSGKWSDTVARMIEQ